MSDFLKNIKDGKIKINLNKNPIKMELFLSFLMVDVVKCSGHLGESTGWTRYQGEDNLIIRGGIIGRCEYLDSLEYKEKLNNPYNNYVNPFYLFEIMTNEGKRFFIDYYSDEIQKAKNNASNDVEIAKRRLESLKKYNQDMLKFWGSLESGDKDNE